MSKNERILALAAALTACKGVIPPELSKELRIWIVTWINSNETMQDFSVFLDKQHKSVHKLAKLLDSTKKQSSRKTN